MAPTAHRAGGTASAIVPHGNSTGRAANRSIRKRGYYRSIRVVSFSVRGAPWLNKPSADAQ